MDQISVTNDYLELLKLIKNSPSPQFPEYETFSKRFHSLNEFSSLTFDKLHLADAGFFYKTRDSVQCWTCGIILSNWLKGDCPFREHARFSTKCPFVLLSKGSEFVTDVNNRFKYKDLNSYCLYDRTQGDVVDG